MNSTLPRSTWTLCAFLITAASTMCRSQEWPRFRGPNGAGQSEVTDIPLSWTPDQCRWRVKLPGLGYSSPVVAGDRVFVTSANEEDGTRFIRCYSAAEGDLLWEKTYASTKYKKHRDCALANATPALDGERVFSTWVTPEQYLVLALDQKTGDELWRRDLGPYKFRHGYGSSPVVHGDMLIVPNDQEGGGKSSIIALDVATGEIRWQVERGAGRTAYAAPCLFTPEDGPAQLVLVSTSHGVSGHDPATGETLWEIELSTKQAVVASPVVVSGLVIASCGSGGVGTRQIAVRPGNPAKGTEAELAYELELNKDRPYVPTPVVNGDLLFVWGDKGVVTCLAGATGNVIWREELGEPFYGSPVLVGDRLYCASRKGTMFVLAAAKEPKQLAKFSLGEESNATPAIANGTMFVRTHSHLMAVGGDG